MKKYLIAALFLIPLTAWAVDKFLDYQFNDNVTIRISNIPCKIPNIDKKKFELAAVARRIDGQFLFGCYTHEKDDIIIQWAGGDQTKLPANYFLIEPNT